MTFVKVATFTMYSDFTRHRVMYRDNDKRIVDGGNTKDDYVETDRVLATGMVTAATKDAIDWLTNQPNFSRTS